MNQTDRNWSSRQHQPTWIFVIQSFEPNTRTIRMNWCSTSLNFEEYYTFIDPDQRSLVVETTHLDEARDEIVAVNGFSANAAFNWSFLWFLLKNKSFSWWMKRGLIQGQEIKASWDNNKRLGFRLRRADSFGHLHLYISDSSFSSSPLLWNKLWSKTFDW